jgi:salicylate 5-hydroxylase small subunit
LLREIEALYYDYADAIDYEIERWPELFTEDALYKVIARENFDRGLPLAAILCEGRGMILDRAMAVRRTIVFAERFMRHAITNVRLVEHDEATMTVRANFAIYETFAESVSRLFAVGRYNDLIVRTDGRLRFAEKICVYDGNLVLGSIIYPF